MGTQCSGCKFVKIKKRGIKQVFVCNFSGSAKSFVVNPKLAHEHPKCPWKSRKEGKKQCFNADNPIQYNTSVQHYDGVPFRLILRSDYEQKRAKRYIIANSNQNFWIPNTFLEKDGTVKVNADLDFIFTTNEFKHKYYLATRELIT